jgi:undecaprenyl-diphosphatase
MHAFQALILGIIQGTTEFLPVSSSGHLIVLPVILGWKSQPLVFDTTMHLATALALIVCFWKDIINIKIAFFRDVLSSHRFRLEEYSTDGVLALAIVVGTIPVLLVGYLWGDQIEGALGTLVGVAVALVLGSILMFIGERSFKKHLVVKDEVPIKKGFGVGLFQVLSLLPGVSRSGSTISGGMIFGLSRKDATRFSFLLSIPAVLAAGLFSLLKSYRLLSAFGLAPLLIGAASAFLVGVVAIRFLMRFVKTNTLYPFIIYRVLLAVFLIFLAIK